MRKSALLLLIVVIVLAGIIGFFLQDHYIERAMERTGEAVVGAKVEIDGLDFSLFGLSCTWQRLQIANPNNTWRNLIETGRASFDLEARPLFWGRILIEEMALEQVRSGSRRSTDGALPVEPGASDQPGLAEKATKAINQRIEALKDLDFATLAKSFKIDSLIDPQKLSSVQGYQKLTSNADSTFDRWQTALQITDYRQRLQAIQSNVAKIKPDSLQNDLIAMAETVKRLDEIRQRITQLKQDIGAQSQALTSDFQSITDELAALKGSVQADIEMAKRRAKLQGLEVKDVALALFGEPVISRIEQMLEYISVGRRYLPAASALFASEEEPSPPRFEGQDIYFPFHYRYPRFLVKKIRLSGMTAAGDSTRGYALEGDIFGLTNEPPVFGQPTRVDLKFYRQTGNHYAIRSVLDHTGEMAKDSLWVSASNIRIGEQKLPTSKYFPASLIAQRGTFDLNGFFIGDALQISLGFQAAPVEFHYKSDSADRVESIVRNVLASVDKIDLSAKMQGQRGDYALSMSSNIDNAISSGVMGVLDQNFRAAQARLENQVRESIARYREQAESRVAAFQQNTMAEVDRLQQRVQAELDKTEQLKKEIEARIDAEKKKAEQKLAEEKEKLEEKAKEGLKSLLKKKKN